MKIPCILLIFLCSCGINNFVSSPPGTIRLNDSTYIDQYPVTNPDYLEFLNCIYGYWSLETSDSLKYLTPYGLTGKNIVITGPDMKIITGTDRKDKTTTYDIYSKPFYGKPDTLFYLEMQLKDTLFYGNLDMNIYLKHPAYWNYPVVYVSKLQAEMYCKWRTDMIRIHDALTIYDSAGYLKHPQIIKYRLPSKREWIESLVNSGIDYSNLPKSKYPNHDSLVHIKYFKQKGAKESFYVLPGYLSEILQEDSIINYNWKDPHEINDIRLTRPFINISNGIGFRCVCEVKKAKPQLDKAQQKKKNRIK